MDAVDPDDEGIAPRVESLAALFGGANKFRHDDHTGLDHLIAEPTHPPCLFDTIGLGKTKIFIDVPAHLVGIEMNRVQLRHQNFRERGLLAR